MGRRFLKIFSALFFPIFVLGAVLWVYSHTPSTPQQPKIKIERGASLSRISQQLAGQKIIRFPLLFSAYARLTGKSGDLQAGTYLFENPVTPREVLENLASGKVLFVKVAVIEGKTAAEIAQILQNITGPEMPSFREEWFQLAKGREGYLFPNTYHLTAETSPADFLEMMLEEFQKNYQAAAAQTPHPPAETAGLTQHEIVTLASIVEKETGVEAERPLIASVFFNRLAKKMPLQSDPTIIYGLKNFDGNIRKEDIANPHPYNTYVHAGLPPGPIGNPGLASLKAVLNPARTEYLYFVSKKDGTHHFSKTAGEHAAAVRKYQIVQ